MWPTFSIPGLNSIARPEPVATACAVGTGLNLSLDVPLPSGLAAGDLMIAHAAWNALGGATTLTAPAGWVQFSRLDRSDDGNFGTVGPVYWKFADSTDAADAATSGTRTFAFNNGTSLRQKLCISSFRYVDQDQPFGAMNLGKATSAAPTNGSEVINCPVIYPSDPFGAILCIVMGSTGSGLDLYENAIPVDNGDYVGLAENVDDSGSSKSGNLLVLWQPRSAQELENLLPDHYRSFNSWTKINATVNDSSAAGDATRTLITFNTTVGSERKAIYKELELDAGVTYSVILYGHRESTTGTRCIWVSLDDGTNEHGGFFQTSALSGGALGSAIGTPDGHYALAGYDGLNEGPFYHVISVTPTVTGTHKLWIGASNTDGAQTTTSDPGDIILMYAQVMRGHYAQYPPRADLVKTPSSAPITSIAGYAGRLVRGIETANPAAVLSVELRRASGAYSRMRLDPLYFNPNYIANAAGNGPGAMLYKNVYPSMFRASAPVFGTSWSASGLGKHYAEIEWSTRESSAAEVGLGIMDTRSFDLIAGPPLTEARTDGYFGDGKVYENGSLKGTYTTWGVGDIIGIAVDFGANTTTFYKNGTSIVTLTSTTGDYPRWLWVRNGSSGSADTDVFEANLTGPFSYLPSGYQAWDWNNEA
jgi:hypothetical protein